MKTYDVIIMTEGSDPVFNVARGIGGYKIASALRNEGYSVFVLNNFSHWIKNGMIKQVLDKLIGDNTLWVGFSSSLFMRKNNEVYTKRHTRDTNKKNILWRWPTEDEDIRKMTDYIRYTKGVKTVYGGSMSYHRAEEVKNEIDYYVVGMGEHTALNITDHLKNSADLNYNADLGTTPYIFDYDQKGALFDFRNTKVNYIPEDFWSAEEAMGIEFGRGCIFKCKFCAYPLIGKKKGDQSFLRDKECIKHELKQNYELYGTTKYIIIDDTFNEQTVKLQAIADAIDEINLPEQLQFSAFIRIDLVAKWPEQLKLLKKINVCSWFLGVESLNYESAKTIGKGCPSATIFETIRKSREVFNGSLSVYGSFIAGLPYDSKETMDIWTKDVIKNKDLFDAFSFSPLELGTASELSKNPERFGYTVYKDNEKQNKWRTKDWDSDEAVEYVKVLTKDFIDDIKVSTFFLMFYQCLGYSFEELRKMTFTELFTSAEPRRKARHFLEKSYYSKVENLLEIKKPEPSIRYMKNLPVNQDLKSKLRKEFYENKSLAKVFTASNEHETKSIDHLRVIRQDDMSNCNVANSIANRVSSIIGCKAVPRYYIQDGDSYLSPHRDHGTITALNIILDGDGPITWNSPISWNEDIDVYYEGALLNVQEEHSVQTYNERVLFKLAIFDKSYDEVLELINGKEGDLFGIDLL